VNVKNILVELRAEHARLQRAIEQLERLYGMTPSANPPRIAVKRLGRPKKTDTPAR